MKEYSLTEKAVRDVAELRAKLEEAYAKWHVLARCMERAVMLSRVRVTTEGSKVRRVEMLAKATVPPPTVAPKATGLTLASCMARAVTGRAPRGMPGPSARAPSVVDLDDLHDEADVDPEVFLFDGTVLTPVQDLLHLFRADRSLERDEGASSTRKRCIRQKQVSKLAAMRHILARSVCRRNIAA